MSDINNIHHAEQSGQTLYTQEQVDRLFREFSKRLELERQQHHQGTEMPLDIIEELENTPPQQLQNNLKQFKREAHKYVPNDWTTPETINRNFLPDLKKYTVETTQVINSIYKVTENTRFQASTAVEIYEQLGYLIEHHREVDAEEAHSLLQQTGEQAKRYRQALDIWSPHQTMEKRKMPLTLSLSNNSTKQDLNRELSKAQTEDEEISSRHEVSVGTNEVERVVHMDEDLFLETGVGVAIPMDSKDSSDHLPATTTTSTPVDSNFTVSTEKSTTATTTSTTTTTTSTGSTSTTITSTTTNEQQQLQRSNGRNSPRGSPRTLPPEMETNHFSPLADISIVQRIPTPVCETASSMEINSTEDVITRTTSRQYSGSEVSRSRYNREVPHTEQEFSLEFLHDSGGHKEETHIKLPTVEPVPSVRAFQDGRCPSPEGNHREERLYLQDRPERCISSSAHPSSFKKIFDLSERRHSLSIPISGLWSQYRSEDLQQDYEICHRTFTQTGHQIDLLSGRHILRCAY
ncbi:hypothetical protein G6F37_012451 [Rhizopus arrhizus]|nr:hypothetical protein G6F38_012297 [Rhizopus arrhizus]KAG1143543.1 hypothetical protein G6F37_012451 [Rhizopus arrhizus]